MTVFMQQWMMLVKLKDRDLLDAVVGAIGIYTPLL
jgi:hypothetical protein